MALLGASPGGFGRVSAQDAWRPILRALGLRLWTDGKLMVPAAGKAVDGEGALADTAIAERLRRYLAGSVASIG